LREYGRSQHNALHFEQLLAGVLCIIEPVSMWICRGIIHNQPATVWVAQRSDLAMIQLLHTRQARAFLGLCGGGLDVQLLLRTFNSDRSQIKDFHSDLHEYIT
jgi:hypothetical protein